MPKKDNQQVAIPTAASSWIRAGEVVELPSGNFARLQRLNLLELIREGQIPDPLAGKLESIISKKQSLEKTAKDVSKNINIEEMEQVLSLVAKNAFLEPKIVDDPQNDNEISIKNVSVDDQSYVFHYANGGLADIERFRNQQARALQTLLDGDKVSPKTK